MENKQIILRQRNEHFYIDSPTEPEGITITKIRNADFESDSDHHFINAIKRYTDKINEETVGLISRYNKNPRETIYKYARSYALRISGRFGYEFLDKTEIGKQIAIHLEEILDPIVQKKKPFTSEDMQKLLSDD